LRVISKGAIAEFSKQYPEALEPLMHWYRVAKHAAWRNLIEIRRDFPHADVVGVLTVFNIGGNNFRLIAAVKYRWQVVYIRNILTHTEYDKDKWK
jgi:mRNA interferase HigB